MPDPKGWAIWAGAPGNCDWFDWTRGGAEAEGTEFVGFMPEPCEKIFHKIERMKEKISRSSNSQTIIINIVSLLTNGNILAISFCYLCWKLKEKRRIGWEKWSLGFVAVFYANCPSNSTLPRHWIVRRCVNYFNALLFCLQGREKRIRRDDHDIIRESFE
jgi:hypothetical protein